MREHAGTKSREQATYVHVHVRTHTQVVAHSAFLGCGEKQSPQELKLTVYMN